jgi:hypothetical protein
MIIEGSICTEYIAVSKNECTEKDIAAEARPIYTRLCFSLKYFKESFIEKNRTKIQKIKPNIPISAAISR